LASSFLPYGRQSLGDDDIEAVTKVLRSDYLTSGPAVEDFENQIAEVTQAKYAVSCSSGTAALHLTAIVLGLGPGDRVIVPSITFLATVNAVRYVGAEVVFSDVDSGTGLMEPENFEAALAQNGDGVRAVYVVHLAGQCPNMAGIAAIARERNIAIVEDASHALGSVYPGAGGDVQVGQCADSDMAIFSFHPVKTIAMGEGGAITTNDSALAGQLKLMRNHGMSRIGDSFVNKNMAFDAEGQVNPWYYEMREPGFNYRASDIHCALGCSQLAKLNRFAERRRTLAALYDQALSSLAPKLEPITKTPGTAVWHLYVVLIDFGLIGVTRANLMRQLSENGIGSQVHYIPVHRQPYYRDRYGETNLPGTDRYYDRCLSLPLFPEMSDSDVERVATALKQVIG